MAFSSPTGRPSWPLRATFGGIALGAVGLLIQWISAPEVFAGFGFPPGLVYVVGAGGIVRVDRMAPWSPIAAVSVALWIVIGGVAGGDLTQNLASPDPGVVLGNVVMAVGLVVAAAAGVVAIVANRRSGLRPPPRPLAVANPHRAAVAVAVAGLLAAAVGDAAPEGLSWDGPGPLLFALLAVLTAVVPGRAAPLLSALFAVVFLMAALAFPESAGRLTDPAEVLPFAGTLTQVIGLAVAVVAGIVAAAPSRRTVGR